MPTRDSLPAIPADCYWNVEHNGQRRAQPVRIEVRTASVEAITAYRDGTRPTIPLSQIVAWDYSTGTPQDIAEVTQRLAKTASNVADFPAGIIA